MAFVLCTTRDSDCTTCSSQYISGNHTHKGEGQVEPPVEGGLARGFSEGFVGGYTETQLLSPVVGGKADRVGEGVRGVSEGNIEEVSVWDNEDGIVGDTATPLSCPVPGD